jgi:hypothetical protein
VGARIFFTATRGSERDRQGQSKFVLWCFVEVIFLDLFLKTRQGLALWLDALWQIMTLDWLFDTGEYSDGYPEAQWGYLGKGVMIDFPGTYGLIHFTEPDKDLALIARKPGSD